MIGKRASCGAEARERRPPRPASAVAGHHVDAATRDSADQSLGTKDAKRFLDGSGGKLVALHESVDGRQWVTRSDLAGLDHLAQNCSKLQVDGLIAEMINTHPTRLG